MRGGFKKLVDSTTKKKEQPKQQVWFPFVCTPTLTSTTSTTSTKAPYLYPEGIGKHGGYVTPSIGVAIEIIGCGVGVGGKGGRVWLIHYLFI